MEIQQIALRLAELCRKPDFEAAQKELFADDATSIEPYATPDFAKETKGLSAIFEKGEKFQTKVEEMHSVDVSEPLVATQSFIVLMKMDVTMKGEGRMQMAELCLYKVKDGKIISEEFFI